MNRSRQSLRFYLLWPTSLALLVAACDFEHGQLVVEEDVLPNSYECACQCGTEVRTATIKTARSEDDAEEVIAGGAVTLTGNTLDMTGPNNNQLVGLRFATLGIPRGSIILSARVQFQASIATTGPANLLWRGEASDNAAIFANTAGNISARPLTTASVLWNPPVWEAAGEGGPDQRTSDLATIVQELVSRPGWVPTNAIVLIVSGTGWRGATAFDAGATNAPRLEVRYREPPVAHALQVCVPSELNPNTGGSRPNAQQLAADCTARVQDTLSGLGAACAYPSACVCTVTAGLERFADQCDQPCAEVPLASDCSNFNPNAGLVTATNAPGDAPVCLATSPLSSGLFGQRSRCVVSGQALVSLAEETKQPAASGTVDIVGTPCFGGLCQVGLEYRVDLAPITYSTLFSSATFVDLAALGETTSDVTLAGGAATVAPDTTAISARGRRGNDSRGVVGMNSDPLALTVAWTPGSAACSLNGSLLGSADPELRRCEGAGPTANVICMTDDECVDDAACSDGDCNCVPVAESEMTLALTVAGPIVNQPPRADAGRDQRVECNLPGRASIVLDASGTIDVDGNLASFRWSRDSRTGPSVGFQPRITVEQPAGSDVTYVWRAIDAWGQADEDTIVVSVRDTIAPAIRCNAPPVITPPKKKVTFRATANDVCDQCITPVITNFACYRTTGNGTVIDTTHSCGVTIHGAAITIAHSGGVGQHIEWSVSAQDNAGNVGTRTCALEVVTPNDSRLSAIADGIELGLLGPGRAGCMANGPHGLWAIVLGAIVRLLLRRRGA